VGEFSAYVAIVVALLVGAISPGPSFIVVARTSLGSSRTAGLRVALGLGLGGVVFALLALIGLIALLSTVDWLFTLLKVAGATYLLYLAVRLWRGARVPLDVGPTERVRSVRSDILRGLVVQLSNPKTAVVYASVFAAVLPSSPSTWLTIALAPSVFVIEAGWYSVVALGFSYARLRRLYERAKTWVDRCTAVVLGGLGVRMILTAGSRNL
jgi:RhtB (resistance to homoserine/threonine) family protein